MIGAGGTLDEQLGHLESELTVEYSGQVAPEVIRDYVREARAGLGEPRVTQFVPLLVDRAVRGRLGRRGRRPAPPGTGSGPA